MKMRTAVLRGLIVLNVLLLLCLGILMTGGMAEEQIINAVIAPSGNARQVTTSEADSWQTINALQTYRVTKIGVYIVNYVGDVGMTAKIYRMSDNALMATCSGTVIGPGIQYAFCDQEQINADLTYASYKIILLADYDSAFWWAFNGGMGDNYYLNGNGHDLYGNADFDYAFDVWGEPGPTPSQTGSIAEAGIGMAGMFTALEGPLPAFIFSFLVALALVGLVGTLVFVVTRATDKIKGR